MSALTSKPRRPAIARSVTLLLCLFLLAVTGAAAEITTDDRPLITFVCEARPDQRNYQEAEVFLTEVFNKLGYRYKQVHAHTPEAIRRIKAGEAHGDCGRLDGFLEHTGLENFSRLGPSYSHGSFSTWYLEEPTKPREEQKVGYNSNTVMLEPNLKAMGYKRLFPIYDHKHLVQLLLDGELDVIINYEQSMQFIEQHPDHKRIKQSDSFMTLPVAAYAHDYLVEEWQPDWDKLAWELLKERQKAKQPRALEIPQKTQGKITFSCSLSANNRLFRELANVYREAFQSLGYEYQQISMPRTRETHELSLGNIHGSCGRTIFHENSQPGATRIKSPVLITDLRVWSRIPYGDIRSINDIPNDANIVMVRGTTYLEKQLKNFKGQVFQAPNMTTAVKMLAAGRVEYLLGFEIAFQNLISDTVINSPIYAIGKLDSLPIYPYMHDSQKVLADNLNQILKVKGAFR